MSILEQPTAPLHSVSFEEEATAVLGKLRDGLAAVIANQKGGTVKKAADLHKALGLNRPLAWSVYRVATATHPRDAGPFVPGSGPMERFLIAAERRGAAAELTADVRRIYQQFEDLVERHAGDREAFESMLAHSDESHREVVDLKTKRDAFRLNGRLWGVQSKAIVLCTIIHPSSVPNKVDAATIRGQVGVCQVRPETPAYSSIRWKNATALDAQTTIEQRIEPLDPDGTVVGGVNLLREFSSKPLPEFRTRTDSENWQRGYLMSPGIGNCAATTYFLGSVARAIDPPFPTQKSVTGYVDRIRRPAELYLRDVLVHRSLWSGEPMQVQIGSGDSGGLDTIEDWNFERLPVQERTIDLGYGIDVLPTTDVPRHREMIDYAMNRLGWPAKEFRVFRCRIDYPIMHSAIRLWFPPLNAQ